MIARSALAFRRPALFAFACAFPLALSVSARAQSTPASVSLAATNPLPIPRADETVGVPWASVMAKCSTGRGRAITLRDVTDWWKYLDQMALRCETPVKVTLGTTR